MNIKSTSRRSIIKMLLFVFLPLFAVSVADAKVQKYRGYIISIDVEAKTMVIQHKRKGEMTLKWNEKTKVNKGKLEDLKPGKGVRNIMNDPEDGFIAVIRIDPAQDKPAE